MMTILDRAKDYLDHGYWVIPTYRATKKPAIEWKLYQTQRPTYEDIEAWFSCDRNIGVVCGEGSGTVVIDADDAAAEVWVKSNCAPTPFRLRTRKGCHFCYRHPGSHVQTKARVIPGLNVDVRGDGGLATGLGSIHETGHLYHLDGAADLVSVHNLPLFDHAWFPKPLVAQTPREKAPYEGIDRFDRASRYINVISGAGKGNRNQTAFQVATAVVRDFALDYEQGMVLMLSWNDQNDPPLPESEISTVVKSAIQAGRKPVGNKLNP